MSSQHRQNGRNSSVRLSSLPVRLGSPLVSVYNLISVRLDRPPLVLWTNRAHKGQCSGATRQRKLTDICFAFGLRLYRTIGIYKIEKLLEEVQCILVDVEAKGQNFNLEKLTLLKCPTAIICELTRNLVSSKVFPGTG